jgi:hypothetical protein
MAGGARFVRRVVFACLLGASVAGTITHASTAESPGAAALHDLSDSGDFRVRVNAALVVGRTRPAGAREALERALGDAHPAVRIAAATALGALGDPGAIAALERRVPVEPSASVKAQLRTTIDQLRASAAVSPPRRQLGDNVRYVVKLGAMGNATGVRGDELRRVLHDAARSRARALRSAALVDLGFQTASASSPAPLDGLLQQAAERHIPVITLDGNVTQLIETRVANSLQIQARVEFAVRREQTLKGTLSGGATTFGSGPTISDQGRRQLQDDAVDGAVQSALRGAESGLMMAGL